MLSVAILKANKSIEKIARMKGLNPQNPDMSLIFHDMSQLSEYTVIRDNSVFKLLKRNLARSIYIYCPGK